MPKKLRPKSLSVNAADTAAASDKLGTNKPWFNGAKFFHMVKLLPPKR